MNHITLIGRIVRDPELKVTASGKSVCEFSLAVKRMFSKDSADNTDFIKIVVWGVLADNCAKYTSKGSQVAVEGRLEISSYEKDGKKNYRTQVIGERVEFLNKAPDQNGSNNNSNNNSNKNNNNYNQNQYDSFELPEDDIPF